MVRIQRTAWPIIAFSECEGGLFSFSKTTIPNHKTTNQILPAVPILPQGFGAERKWEGTPPGPPGQLSVGNKPRELVWGDGRGWSRCSGLDRGWASTVQARAASSYSGRGALGANSKENEKTVFP